MRDPADDAAWERWRRTLLAECPEGGRTVSEQAERQWRAFVSEEPLAAELEGVMVVITRSLQRPIEEGRMTVTEALEVAFVAARALRRRGWLR